MSRFSAFGEPLLRAGLHSHDWRNRAETRGVNGAMGEATEFGIDGDPGPKRPGLFRRGRSWRPGDLGLARAGSGIPLDASGPAQPSRASAKRVFALLLWIAVTAAAAAVHYHAAQILIPVTWLAVGPLLASLLLAPLATAALAGWAVLLGLGLMLDQPGHPEGLASRVSVLVLLAAFAVVNAVLRAAAQRRLSQVRAVARVAQSAVLREVPTTVTAGRLASRYLSAAAEAQVGGDLLEVVSSGGRSRWLIGDTRGKGLPAVRLASLAMTSFRDACAQPGLALPEIARVVDQSVTRAVGDEGFVTAVFAEFDPRGWLPTAACGRWHPTHMRHRSACTRTSRRPRSRSARATGCCSTPTACWRRATVPAGSSAWTTARTRCASPISRRPPTNCSDVSWRIPAAGSKTTSRCCCSRPRLRRCPSAHGLKNRPTPPAPAADARSR